MAWRIEIVLVLALAFCGLRAGPASEAIHFYRLPVQGCDFYFSRAYEKNVRAHALAFQESIKRLSIYLEDLSVPERCHVFFVVNGFELRTLLEERYRLGAAQADLAVQAGVFRRGQDSIILAGQAGLDWSSGIFLIEYARLALYNLLEPAGDAGAAWFREGFAVCLAWYAANPNELSAIEKYYSSFFDARRVRPLGALFQDSSYRRIEDLHGTHVLAQSVLAAYYFSRRMRDFRCGLLLLKLYVKEKNFQTAFERASGITLERFEDEVNKMYFPLFRNSVRLQLPEFQPGEPGHSGRAGLRAHA